MKFRHLRIFKCLCEEMNMTKAAKRLFISQPSVSQAIRELEENYQCRLFERLSHKLYLTESGEVLLKYAEHIIALNSELNEVMDSISKTQKIRVGATVTIGTYCIAQLIEKFTKETQGIEIITSLKNTQEIEKSILNATIDLALVEGIIDASDIIVRPYMKDELIIICHEAHRLRGKNRIRKEDLEKERFLIREEGSGSRRMFLEMLQKNHIDIQVAGEFTNNEAIKNGVMSGLGLGVVSKASISKHDQVFELAIKGMKMTRDFSIVYHKNKFLNKSIVEFINYTQTSFMADSCEYK